MSRDQVPDKAIKSEDPLSDLDDDDDEDFRAKIFPQRLMEILLEERNHDAITWLPHGRAFIIRNRKAFAEKVMPKCFPRKSKYSSFTRKLNRWNFVRISSGPELGAYYHEFFLRDKPHLAAQMFCKNARTRLAMAAVSESEAKPQEPAVPVVASTSAPNVNGIPPQLVAAAAAYKQKCQLLLGVEEQVNKQLLEQQLSLFQNADHNRLLLEQAMQNVGVSRQQMFANALALQQQQSQAAQLLQMRELIELQRLRRGHGNKPRTPTNNRASAA